MRLFALYGLLTLTLLAQVPGVVNTNRGMIAPSNGVRYGNILFPGGIPPGMNTHAGRLGGKSWRFLYRCCARSSARSTEDRRRSLRLSGLLRRRVRGLLSPGEQPSNLTVVVPQQQVPQVIINNGYTPETANPVLREYGEGELPESSVRVYDGSSKKRAEPATRSDRSVLDEKPTIYLIALKDGTLRQAIGYWTQGDTLHYVTPDSR